MKDQGQVFNNPSVFNHKPSDPPPPPGSLARPTAPPRTRPPVHPRPTGYFLEVLGADYLTFDASLYGALLVVDPEEEFFAEELGKLEVPGDRGATPSLPCTLCIPGWWWCCCCP